MKLFAMLMLRCAFVMILFSFIQNGTLADLDKWKKFQKWSTQCQEMINELFKAVEEKPSDINQKLDLLLKKVNEFPIGGMVELLKRRLQKPLKIAIGNCKKLEEEPKKVEHSGREDNKLAKRRSIAKGIDKEFNTFFFEVELELIEKDKWTSGNKKEFENLFRDLFNFSENKVSFCDTDSFKNAWNWAKRVEKTKPPPNQKELDEQLLSLIFEAKLRILEKELSAKIAGFAEQIDVDGFIRFSDDFKADWKQFEHKMINANIADKKIADTEKTFRKRLKELADRALEETAPLKTIITEKLNELCPGPLKIVFKKAFKSDQKEQKEAQINAKKVINDIGMFDGAANKLLVDNADFSCAKLKEAVEKDKKMVLKAYQVNDKELLRNMKIEIEK
uniref:Uncharacterized protein n=1 Tax=Globodera rostochiensis TaxID=31243 RepID=A0A914HIY7_GLORO